MQNRLTKLFTLLLLSFFTLNVFAQEDSDYTEIDVPTSSGNYNVITIADQGLLMFYEGENSTKSGMSTWEFVKINTDLEEDYNKTYDVDRKASFIDYKYQNGILYLFFTREKSWGGPVKNYKGEFSILSFDVKDGSFEEAKGMLPSCSITGFNISNGNTAYLSGFTIPTSSTVFLTKCLCYVPVPVLPYLLLAPSIIKAKNLVISIDLPNSKLTAMQQQFKKNSFVVGSQSRDDGNVDVIIRNDLGKKESLSFLYTYGPDGEVISKSILGKKKKNLINNGSLSKTGSGEKVVLGTYSSKRVSQSFFAKLMFPEAAVYETVGGTSSGFYISLYENDEQVNINYYPFNKIKSFEEYNGGRKKKKKKKKKEKPVETGVLMHKVFKVDNQYLAIGELYYKVYRQESYYNASTNRWETRTVFDGYVFYSAFIASFDKEGELLWDNKIALQVPKTFDYSEKVTVRYSDSEGLIDFIYVNRTTAVIESLDTEGESVNDKIEFDLSPKFSASAKKTEYTTNAGYWYGDYFLSYGNKVEKRKKSKSKGRSKKKTTFFFKKVNIQDAI